MVRCSMSGGRLAAGGSDLTAEFRSLSTYGRRVEVSEAEVVPLLEPREGIPPVIETPEGLQDAVERLAAGEGPVAVDAERASGYRYGQRAYLVQLRRRGSGTFLIDPVP